MCKLRTPHYAIRIRSPNFSNFRVSVGSIFRSNLTFLYEGQEHLVNFQLFCMEKNRIKFLKFFINVLISIFEVKLTIGKVLKLI